MSNKLTSFKAPSIPRISFRQFLPSTIPVIKSDESKWISIESREDTSLAVSTAYDSNQDLDLPTELPLQAEDGLLPPKPQ